MSQQFSPHYGSGVSIAATTSSGNTAFTANGANALAISLDSITGATVFVKIGDTAQTATTADLPITGAGGLYIVPIDGTDDNIAGVTASGSSTVRIIPGNITVGR